MSEEKEFVSDLIVNEKDDKQKAIENRKRFEENIQNMWGYSSKGIEAKRAAMTMLSTKTGMYARIPLICKADNCPYADTCQLLCYNLAPYSEPCPIETAQIDKRLKGYDEDFDLEGASFTDNCLVTELINLDIMIERAKALINKDGILVEDVVAGMSQEGEVYYRPEVSKNVEVYERLIKKRNDLYDLMMATRNKQKDEDNANNLSSFINDLIEQQFVVEERPKEFIDINGEQNNENEEE